MVFFMNEGDMPSPVLGQRSACSATQAGPGGPGRRPPATVTLPLSLSVGLHRRFRSASTSRCGRRWTVAEEGPADAHHGRPGRHRGLEVVAHAHGALLEPQVGRPAAPPSRRPPAPRPSPGAATVMRPRTSSPRSPQPRHQLGRPPPGGSRCGPAGPSCRPAPGPRPRARSGRSARPRPRGPRSATRPTSGASCATLFRCTAPRKCQTTPASSLSAAAFATSSAA